MRAGGTLLLLALAGCSPALDGDGERGVQTRFLPNRGQWREEVLFAMAPSRGLLLHDGWALSLERRDKGGGELHGNVVRMRFRGAEPEGLEGLDPLSGRHHFLLGADPDRWVRNLTGYRRVRYRELYRDIDLIVRGEPDPGVRGLLEYDLMLGPGADLAGVVVECEGIAGLDLDPDGSLVMRVPFDGGEVLLRQDPPVSWVEGTDEVRRAVTCRYVVLDAGCFGFSVEGWDGGDPLVLDPGLVWSTYLGGGSSDSASDSSWRPGEGMWVGGWSGSLDFPTTPGAFSETGMRDAFITRLGDDGEVLFSTYLGGSLAEEVRAVEACPDGTAVVAGWTGSPDFPVTGDAFQPAFGGASALLAVGDGFVARLSADGSQLVYGSFLGGEQDDVVEDLAVDGGGAVLLVGQTGSPDFPVTSGAAQTVHGGTAVIADGFVTRISRDGVLEFSTFLGGSGWDQLDAVGIDAAGLVTASGCTSSADFPITSGAFQPELLGYGDAVVVRLAAGGGELLWSTRVGGGGTEEALALDLDEVGAVTVVGFTTSKDFPVTAGVLQPAPGGREDGFLACLAPDGGQLLWGSYLGGEGDDRIEDLAVDSLGDISVAGRTASRMFPISSSAPQVSFGGGATDGFLARLDGKAERVLFATYHGGGAEDHLASVDVSGDGFAAVSGWTWSEDLPVSEGSFQGSSGGVQEAMLAVVDLVPEPGWVEVRADPLSDVPLLFDRASRIAVLSVVLENMSPEPAGLQSLRLLVAGIGDNVEDIAALRVYQDRNRTGAVDPGDPLVAGPAVFTEDNRPLELAVTGLSIPAGGSSRILVELEVADSCTSGAEFTAVITGLDAWCLRTARTRKLRLRGDARIQGPVHACVSFVRFADPNGDGVLDAGDLRRLARRLGEAAMGDDPDEDGWITAADLELFADRLLTRPILVTVPGEVSAPGELTLQGHGLAAGAAEVTLGGSVLQLLSVTDRELVLGMDPEVPRGSQELDVKVGGIHLPRAFLTVR